MGVNILVFKKNLKQNLAHFYRMNIVERWNPIYNIFLPNIIYYEYNHIIIWLSIIELKLKFKRGK